VRKLTVLFKRNEATDNVTDDIYYKGFDPYWENGEEINAGIATFCDRGIRLLFGSEEKDEYLIDIYVATVFGKGSTDVIKDLPKPLKRRRMYALIKHYDKPIWSYADNNVFTSYQLYFFNGVATDIELDRAPATDPIILNWIFGKFWWHNTDALVAGALWLDFTACPKGQLDGHFPVVCDFTKT